MGLPTAGLNVLGLLVLRWPKQYQKGADMILTSIACLLSLLVTISIHAEGLSIIRFEIESRSRPDSERIRLTIVVMATILLHVMEISFYAAMTWFLNIALNVGDIIGDREFTAMDYFYYSAQTFTSLGTGDLVATGGLRMIASLEPLNGLVLIAWTGAFTYWAMGHYWNGKLLEETKKVQPFEGQAIHPSIRQFRQ